MPMLPAGGNNPPISMSDINSAYAGRGNNLNAYRGTLYYRPDNSTGYLPAGAISISDFYNTSGTTPVVPGSFTVSGGGVVTLPSMFNYLWITCYGGGGGGGQGGKCTGYGSIYGGSAGGNGGGTYFMPGTGFQVYGPGGGGGGGGGGIIYNAFGGVAAGGNGSPGSTGSGGGGGGGGGGGSGTGGPASNGAAYPYTLTEYGSSGGNGGQGGNSGEVLIMNRDTMGFDAIKAYYNANVGISIGGGGGGGSSGYNAGYAGGGGGGGWIVIRWA